MTNVQKLHLLRIIRENVIIVPTILVWAYSMAHKNNKDRFININDLGFIVVFFLSLFTVYMASRSRSQELAKYTPEHGDFWLDNYLLFEAVKTNNVLRMLEIVNPTPDPYQRINPYVDSNLLQIVKKLDKQYIAEFLDSMAADRELLMVVLQGYCQKNEKGIARIPLNLDSIRNILSFCIGSTSTLAQYLDQLTTTYAKMQIPGNVMGQPSAETIMHFTEDFKGHLPLSSLETGRFLNLMLGNIKPKTANSEKEKSGLDPDSKLMLFFNHKYKYKPAPAGPVQALGQKLKLF
jgi:hypothetical protein